LIILFITRTHYSLNILFSKKCTQTHTYYSYRVFFPSKYARCLNLNPRDKKGNQSSSFFCYQVFFDYVPSSAASLLFSGTNHVKIDDLTPLTPNSPSEAEYYANSTNLIKRVVLGRINRGYVIYNEEPFEPNHC